MTRPQHLRLRAPLARPVRCEVSPRTRDRAPSIPPVGRPAGIVSQVQPARVATVLPVSRSGAALMIPPDMGPAERFSPPAAKRELLVGGIAIAQGASRRRRRLHRGRPIAARAPSTQLPARLRRSESSPPTAAQTAPPSGRPAPRTTPRPAARDGSTPFELVAQDRGGCPCASGSARTRSKQYSARSVDAQPASAGDPLSCGPTPPCRPAPSCGPCPCGPVLAELQPAESQPARAGRHGRSRPPATASMQGWSRSAGMQSCCARVSTPAERSSERRCNAARDARLNLATP